MMRLLRAGQRSTPPLNCSVRRQPDVPQTIEQMSAEATRFFEDLRGDFDTSQALVWNFLVDNVQEASVSALMSDLEDIGFPEVDVPDDATDEGIFSVWCSETRVHSKQSFVTRVLEVERVASKYAARLDDYSGGRSDAS
jgi:hypothetical protein